MNIKSKNGFYYITSALLEEYNIPHLFTTIKDEADEKPCDFGFNVLKREDVIKNYGKVADIFNVDVHSMVKSTQIHEDNILEILPKDKGTGITSDISFENADGIYTGEKNIPLCIFWADCVPVLIADKKGRVVMGVHAGWRGTAKDITGKAVRILKEKYGIKNEDIIAAIGPAIGKCCYEVSSEVAEEIGKLCDINLCSEKIKDDKYYLDLKKANKLLLLKEGVLEENTDVCEFCTKCEKELFHSYRRDKTTGRNAGFIMKKV